MKRMTIHLAPFLAAASLVFARAPESSVDRNSDKIDFGYRSQMEHSDLVLIGSALYCQDTSVTNEFSDGHSTFACTGIETTFKVELIFKGTWSNDTVTVFHYRLPDGTNETCWLGGMHFVTFALPDRNRNAFDTDGRPDYFLFLKKSEDGHYIPAMGQGWAVASAFEVSDMVFAKTNAVSER